MAEVGALADKGPQVAEESWLGHENNNPGVEWILGEPWRPVRNGLYPVQIPFSALLGRVALRIVVRREPLGRNTEHVSNPGQGDVPLAEPRTTLLPPRMTGSSVGQLLSVAARIHRHSASPTDSHSLLMCPNCGIVQDSVVCSGQALEKKENFVGEKKKH